jgi:hypothetical protein
MSIFLEGNARAPRKADNLPAICDCLENVGFSMPHNISDMNLGTFIGYVVIKSKQMKPDFPGYRLTQHILLSRCTTCFGHMTIMKCLQLASQA